MNYWFKNPLKSLIDLEKRKFDQRLLIFLFFFLVSTIFWFLNALSREYIADIKYPVRYINFPSNKILVNELPRHFVFKVESHGYNLLKYKLRPGIQPVVININSYRLSKEANIDEDKYFLLTSRTKDNIANQISSELRLLEIKPDSLVFEFSTLIKKTVKVIPDVNMTLEKPYMIRGEIMAEPDSIVISGPNSIIDTLDHVKTKYIRLKNITQNIEKNITLQGIDKVSFSTKKVNVKIPVDQFTEIKTKVPIHVINVPDTIVVKTFPTEVDVTYLVSLTDYKDVLVSMFHAEVDFYQDLGAHDDFLTIKITRYPGFIKALRFNPQKVEYVIEK